MIDCGPDFRAQALRHNIKFVDAVIVTHTHADHIMGIHELKQAHNKFKATPVYVHENDFADFERMFGFSFNPTDKIYYKFTQPITYKSYDLLEIGDVKVQTIEQFHGVIKSQGIVIDNFAYCTDVKSFSEESIQHLYNLDVLVLDCLRPSFSPSHFGLDALLEFVEKIKPKQVYLTHINHDTTHEEFKKILPPNIEPCFDGMEVHVK